MFIWFACKTCGCCSCGLSVCACCVAPPARMRARIRVGENVRCCMATGQILIEADLAEFNLSMGCRHAYACAPAGSIAHTSRRRHRRRRRCLQRPPRYPCRAGADRRPLPIASCIHISTVGVVFNSLGAKRSLAHFARCPRGLFKARHGPAVTAPMQRPWQPRPNLKLLHSRRCALPQSPVSHTHPPTVSPLRLSPASATYQHP
jgi:hypothetical protein